MLFLFWWGGITLIFLLVLFNGSIISNVKSFTMHSLIGSAFVLVVSLSCCWLTALIIAVGGGSTLIGLNSGLEAYSSY